MTPAEIVREIERLSASPTPFAWDLAANLREVSRLADQLMDDDEVSRQRIAEVLADAFENFADRAASL